MIKSKRHEIIAISWGGLDFSWYTSIRDRTAAVEVALRKKALVYH